ncbi:hypothetical protein, partial [Haemophilus sp. SZY H54]
SAWTWARKFLWYLAVFLGKIHPISWVEDITCVDFAFGVDSRDSGDKFLKRNLKLPFTPLWSLSGSTFDPSIGIGAG